MESEKITQTFMAGADLSLKERFAVKYGNTAGQVILTAAETDIPVGVIADGGGNTSGHAVSVVTAGRCKVKAGGVITVHARVSGAASGKIAASASTHFVLGRIEQAPGADNDEVTIFVRPMAVPLA